MTNRILYSYTGVVLPTSVKGLIKAISVALTNHNVVMPHHRKIIRISLEALQNLARHGKWLNYTTIADTSFFIINEHEDSYTITTGNFMGTSNIANLKKKLNAINVATDIEITQRFRGQLKQNALINAKGAGLGLMDMRRKSGTKLTFTFQNSTPISSFFQLSITLHR